MDYGELLERFAPYLQYDAQDGYRAVSAATMTDAPCNCLVARGQGTVIAGKGSLARLSLETLSDYPGSLEFADGDHLASAPNPLEDAVRMQGEVERFPHCAYARAVPVDGSLWLEYWLWYYDNPKTFLGSGRHQGDWELVVIELDREHQPRSVTCSQHTAGEARPWSRVTKHEGDHALIYVAPFSHANYFQPGTRFFFPGADHPTDVGPAPVRPEVAEFGDWQEWRGQWGSSVGVLMGPKLLRPLVKGRLGGQSPSAPIAQEQRWSRPDLYHRRASLSKPIAGAKLTLWYIGKATYPLAPKITGATLERTRLTIEYELPSRGPHRSKHLLLTVHGGGQREEMLLSQVIRKARRRGRKALEIPPPPSIEGNDRGGVVVYASAFNALGQRSDPVRFATAPLED